MPGPLDGVRVVDFGQYLAGPLTAMLLADQGADVIRVDPPDGPRWDSPANAALNRGKRSITLNLKRTEDSETARRLIASADVVIENFRPGVMDRLGLGADMALEVNPRLTYCSLPGFASDDPRASMPAWEGVVAATTDTYRPPRGEDGAPVYTAIPIASMFAAFTAATSIAAALYSREQDGRGQRIEVPLFDAMFEAIGAHGLRVNGGPAGERPRDFAAGVLQASDGRWVQFALAKPHFIAHFVEAAGIGDRFDLERLRVDADARAELFALLPEVIASRPADEWERLAIASDVPLMRVRSAAEWEKSEHARTSRIFVGVEDPRFGVMRQPNAPLRMHGSDAGSPKPARALNADRAAILDELDAPPSPVMAPASAARSAALEGVRVLDLSLVLAGPMAGRTLAEFGADVIKVNPPVEEGAGIQFSRHRYHTDVNRGKRSLFLDLKQPEDRERFWQLLERSDVVVHNFRGGVLERLGIDYETVRRRKPDIIYAGVGSYGSPGPWCNLPAYEPFGQAVTGMSARQGGDGRPSMQPYAVNDYGTGLLAAYAAILALYHRARTGEGQTTEAALAYTGTFLQLPHLLRTEGAPAEPRGIEARGSRMLHRLWRAADGWFFAGGHEHQRDTLLECADLEAAHAAPDDEVARQVEERFAERPCEEWCARLVAAGLGAHRLVALDELMRDPWVVAHGLSITREHDTGEVITTTGPGARLSATPVVPGRPAPEPGSDRAAILDEIG